MLRKQFVRYDLMKAHMRLAKGSEEEMLAAKQILRLLRKGEMHCGLDNVGWIAEDAAEKAGCRIRYTRNFGVAIVRI